MKRYALALLTAWLLWGGAGPLCAQNSGDDRELFLPAKVGAETVPPADLDTYAESYRPIRLNWRLLDPRIRDPRVVHATLAPGKRRQLLLERVEVRAPDDFTWRGRIVGEEGSEFTLTCYRDAAALDLRGPETGQFMLRCLQNSGIMLLCAVRQDRPRRCETIGPRMPAPEPPGGGVGAQTTIDVTIMIVYNATVRDLLGGENAAHAAAQGDVDLANNVYGDSVTNVRLTLVNAQTIGFGEDDSYNTMLGNLQNDSTVASLRDDYRADLVSLLSSRPSSTGVGLLPFYDTIDHCANSGYGFSVCNYTDANAQRGLAHETGHNFGCGHGYGDGDGYYAYSQGYRFEINGVLYRDIMALDETVFFRVLVLGFSDPDRTVTGSGGTTHPFGDADHNCTRTIRDTAQWIGLYRALNATQYVDGDPVGWRNGRQGCAWATLARALQYLPNGQAGTLYFSEGHYNEPMTLNRPLTLQYLVPPVGGTSAVIGVP